MNRFKRYKRKIVKEDFPDRAKNFVHISYKWIGCYVRDFYDFNFAQL